jgi:hypothetical protein
MDLTRYYVVLESQSRRISGEDLTEGVKVTDSLGGENFAQLYFMQEQTTRYLKVLLFSF